ncbi:MAG: amidohydrolase family protein [Pirellulaceae bacterium]
MIIAGVFACQRIARTITTRRTHWPLGCESAGVRFCISCSERFGSGIFATCRTTPPRRSPGLPADDALRGITLSPAEIGVADRVGSLESGKDATLIVTDGNPLETATQVETAFVQGRRVELNDRHKRLWKKYEEKYRRQTADE